MVELHFRLQHFSGNLFLFNCLFFGSLRLEEVKVKVKVRGLFHAENPTCSLPLAEYLSLCHCSCARTSHHLACRLWPPCAALARCMCYLAVPLSSHAPPRSACRSRSCSSSRSPCVPLSHCTHHLAVPLSPHASRHCPSPPHVPHRPALVTACVPAPCTLPPYMHLAVPLSRMRCVTALVPRSPPGAQQAGCGIPLRMLSTISRT